jgi:hypothetical protein
MGVLEPGVWDPYMGVCEPYIGVLECVDPPRDGALREKRVIIKYNILLQTYQF